MFEQLAKEVWEAKSKSSKLKSLNQMITLKYEDDKDRWLLLATKMTIHQMDRFAMNILNKYNE